MRQEDADQYHESSRVHRTGNASATRQKAAATGPASLTFTNSGEAPRRYAAGEERDESDCPRALISVPWCCSIRHREG